MASNATHCTNYSKAGACRDRDTISVSCLPEEVWQSIALNLSAEDVLSLLCVNRRLYVGLGQSICVWEMLSKRDGISCYEQQEPLTDQNNRCSAQQKQQKRQQPCFAKKDEESEWRTVKNSYLFRCHKTDPSKSSGGVRWYPVRPYGQFAGISDREGHLSCVLSRYAISQYDPLATLPISENEHPHATPHERIVAITGGFSNDDSIYLIHAGTGTTAINKNNNTDVAGRHHHWDMKRIDPIGRGPSFAYGATLTALPTIYSESPADGDRPHTLTATMRAIRFGGFLAGGYSNETSNVLMLTVKQDANQVQKRQQRRRGKRERHFNDSSDDGEEIWSALEWQWNRKWEVEWSNITTTGITTHNMHEQFLPRAYHSSTLLLDRYLVVIGGMITVNSIMNEAVLDTKTWTWMGNGAVACGLDTMDSRPSGRHGHSVVLDDSRNRLVLYGGGSGSDLLRSGEDNSEVWELQLGEGWRDSEKFAESFPWKWKQLHEDSNIISNDNNSDENEETTGSTSDSARSCAPKLSPSETLCLGRCHHGIKISRDTVLFIFGSGRPSTNGLLAYDLRSDNFFRKQNSSQQLEPASLSTFSDFCSTSGAVYVKGILPKPRFTGVAAFLEEDGYIITHGGYCSQDHDTIGTIDVLDLAPGVRGRLNNHASTFDGMAIDDWRVSYGEVSDSQAERGRQDPHAAMQRMLTTLMNKPASERQAAASIMLHEMECGERPSNGQSLMLMAMIANGNQLLVGSEGEEGSDSE